MNKDERWEVQRTGFHLKRRGDLRLMVGKFGAKYRVLVTRTADDTRSEKVFYSGIAANADDAMAIAERMAERVASQHPKGDAALQKQQKHPTGIYLTRRAGINLVVEHVGTIFSVVVTYVTDEGLPEKAIFAGSARNAEDAFALGHEAAERASIRGAG